MGAKRKKNRSGYNNAVGRRELINTARRAADSKLFVFFFCGIAGALVFIRYFGGAVLDFTYTDWLHKGNWDLPQHYYGWRFYRASDWTFPIGLMDGIIHPFKESMVFTDSIPLFAVPFKAVSRILPGDFQYFGLFGLMCYFMQGAVGGLTAKRISGNTPFACIASGLFVLSTAMAWRMFWHTSLAAHFIILLCIYVCITKDDKPRKLSRDMAVWAGLMCLAAAVHIYFIVMTGVFMAFYLLDDLIAAVKKARKTKESYRYKLYLPPFITGAAAVISALLLLFVLGAFHSKNTLDSFAAGGLGRYSANITAVINPQNAVNPQNGMSRFLSPLPIRSSHQYEGNGYIGLGVILGVIVSCIIFAYEFIKTKFFPPRQSRTPEKTADTSGARRIILALALFLVFYAIALSPSVTFGDTVLFTYPLPEYIERIWTIFRHSGRFIWIPVYILTVFVIRSVWQIGGKRFGVTVIAVLLSVQFMDVSGYIENKGQPFLQKTEWESPYTSDDWVSLAENRAHIFFLDERPEEFALADYALTHNMSVNDFYLARRPAYLIDTYKREELQRIYNGSASDDTLYIISDNITDMLLEYPEGSLYMYNIDGLTVGLSAPFEFEDENVYPAYVKWVQEGGNRYYVNPDGSYIKGEWVKWDNDWYYLDSETGIMSADRWIYYNGAWHYVKSSGRMASGEWLELDGEWYYLKAPDGAMLSGGTYTVDGREYTFDSSGALIP